MGVRDDKPQVREGGGEESRLKALTRERIHFLMYSWFTDIDRTIPVL